MAGRWNLRRSLCLLVAIVCMMVAFCLVVLQISSRYYGNQHVTARTQPYTVYVLRHSDRDNATVITYRHLCQDHGEREIPDVTSMRRSNYSVPYQPVSERNFTLVMVTHERDRLLKTLLRRYSTMTNIASIIVYWNNPRRTPPDLTKDMDFRMPLVIVELSMTSLRLRYQPLPEIRTNG